jgi:hypothetical protein
VALSILVFPYTIIVITKICRLATNSKRKMNRRRKIVNKVLTHL